MPQNNIVIMISIKNSVKKIRHYQDKETLEQFFPTCTSHTRSPQDIIRIKKCIFSFCSFMSALANANCVPLKCACCLFAADK